MLSVGKHHRMVQGFTMYSRVPIYRGGPIKEGGLAMFWNFVKGGG